MREQGRDGERWREREREREREKRKESLKKMYEYKQEPIGGLAIILYSREGFQNIVRFEFLNSINLNMFS